MYWLDCLLFAGIMANIFVFMTMDTNRIKRKNQPINAAQPAYNTGLEYLKGVSDGYRQCFKAYEKAITQSLDFDKAKMEAFENGVTVGRQQFEAKASHEYESLGSYKRGYNQGVKDQTNYQSNVETEKRAKINNEYEFLGSYQRGFDHGMENKQACYDDGYKKGVEAGRKSALLELMAQSKDIGGFFS